MSLTSVRTNRVRWVALPATFVLAVGLSACGAANEGEQAGGGAAAPEGQELSGNIRGAGASAMQVAQEAWIATFTQSNPGVSISYDPVGSGGGRTQFIDGATVFGGTDEALDDEELAAATERCAGEPIQLPVYISPIALTYNLPGVDNLQLSPAAAAGIFSNQITTWNDPAIVATNPGVPLPAENIVSVHRADDSGTTENFTDYLAGAAPEAWPFEVEGTWPAELQGEAAQGTSGVANIVRQTPFSITYADESQVRDLSSASLQVGQDFVGPTPEAAALIFADSPRAPTQQPFVFSYELNRATEAAGTYPAVLVSYMLACGNYPDPETAANVSAFANYVISEEGQQVASEQAGSAPLSPELRQEFQPAVDAIG